jgi:hypothetical protein
MSSRPDVGLAGSRAFLELGRGQRARYKHLHDLGSRAWRLGTCFHALGNHA